MKRRGVAARAVLLTVLVGADIFIHSLDARAQSLVDPSLGVSTVVEGLNQPIAMALIGPDDILVTEKASGSQK